MRRTQLPESPTACAALALLLLMPLPAAAQDVTEPALKAAFIYNFAKFTEWPADVMSTAAPLHLCVLGDPAIGDALERVVQGRTLAGHGIEVSRAESAGPPRAGCHILYVSGVTAEQAASSSPASVTRRSSRSAMSSGFTQLGGMAQFFFKHGQLRFSVQVEAARRARLQISSRLLALATHNEHFHPHPRGLGRRHARRVDLRLGPIAVAR